MSISPFSTRPAAPDGEARRTRLALAIATVGIAATLLAYALSPGVRHAVSHAAHSVKHAVSHVLDRDKTAARHTARPHTARPVHPARRVHAAPQTQAPRSGQPARTGTQGAPRGG